MNMNGLVLIGEEIEENPKYSKILGIYFLLFDVLHREDNVFFYKTQIATNLSGIFKNHFSTMLVKPLHTNVTEEDAIEQKDTRVKPARGITRVSLHIYIYHLSGCVAACIVR